VRNGGAISTATHSIGSAGTVSVQAGHLFISGDGAPADTTFTGIGSQSWSTAKGNGGQVEVSAGDLQVRNGGAISTNTYSTGSAGTVKVWADRLLISGDHPWTDNTFTGIRSEIMPNVEGGAGQVEVSAGDLQVRNGGAISTATHSIGSAGEFFGYDWSGGLTGLPEDLQALRLSAATVHFFDGHWRGVAFASSSLHYEEGADVADGGSYSGGVGAAYRFGPELTLGALLGAVTRIEDDPSLFLMPYVEWKPSAHWTIRTEMRDGVGLEGMVHVDEKGVWSLLARGVFSERRFRLGEDAVRPNGIFEDSRFTVMVGGRWQPHAHLSVSLILGWDLRQQYALEDESGREREEFESRPGMVLGFHLTASF
jgi:hypothetical protein